MPAWGVTRDRRRTVTCSTDRPGACDPLVVAGQPYASRLLVGTGKFRSHAVMRDALVASAAQIVTVALRRVD